MKFVSACVVVLVLGACAEAPSTLVVIKGSGCIIVTFLQFSPDGRELARACGFGPIEMFETATYKKARTFRLEIDHTPELQGFAYSPDGKTIATARGHSGAVIWNAADPGRAVPSDGQPLRPFYGVDEVCALEMPLHVLEPNTASSDKFGSVLAISYSRDSNLVFTTHPNGHLKIWNTSTWTLQRELVVSEKGNRALSSVLTISPDGETFVIGDESGVLHYRSLAANAELRTLRPLDGTSRVASLLFSPDGKTLVATYRGAKVIDGSAIIWNTTDWTVHTESTYTSAAFSQDGKLLALGGPDIELIDTDSRRELRAIDLPQFTKAEVLPDAANDPDAAEKIPCSVQALAFSPDGKTLAVGCFEGTLRILKLVP